MCRHCWAYQQAPPLHYLRAGAPPPQRAANAARDDAVGAAHEAQARAGEAFDVSRDKVGSAAEQAADKGREAVEGTKERAANLGENVKVGQVAAQTVAACVHTHCTSTCVRTQCIHCDCWRAVA